MDQCLLLCKIPAELRLRIYEYILAFDRPLKLRQVVAGSKNTSILRANRQIYQEALPIFYESNTIIATRNDFCQDTDPELQTPLRRDEVRHLLICNFSQSIRCSSYSGGNNLFLDGCCDVCKPTTTGFIIALGDLPRLQTAVIDYHNHQREFQFIKEILRMAKMSIGSDYGFTITYTDIARCRIDSPALPPNLNITFADLPFSAIWNELALHKSQQSCPQHVFPNEDTVLQRLREDEDRDLPDSLNVLACIVFGDPQTPGDAAQMWREMSEAKAEGRDTSEMLERLTEEFVRFTKNMRGFEARAMVRYVRERLAPALDEVR